MECAKELISKRAAVLHRCLLHPCLLHPCLPHMSSCPPMPSICHVYPSTPRRLLCVYMV